MYKCAVTGKVSQPGEPAYKIVTETRPKSYYAKDKKTGEMRKVGEGFEIVKELVVCKEVYQEHIKE